MWSPSVQRKVGPGMRPLYVQAGNFNAGNDLNIFVERYDLVFAQGSAVWHRGYFTVIKVGQNICWIEAVFFMIHFAYGSRQDAVTVLHWSGETWLVCELLDSAVDFDLAPQHLLCRTIASPPTLRKSRRDMDFILAPKCKPIKFSLT